MSGSSSPRGSEPSSQSFTGFHGQYFIGIIVVDILRFIWIFLWSLLFLVPGLIKSLAYSQAFYIYKDAVDNHVSMEYRDAITKSRDLMRGHKWELFVLDLSFIGWALVAAITFGLADFWVYPYIKLTLAQFYRSLIQRESKSA